MMMMITMEGTIKMEDVNDGNSNHNDNDHVYDEMAELQIVFRYHGPNDPWLCKMMGQFSKEWVNDNLKCTHLNHSLYLWKTLADKVSCHWLSALSFFFDGISSC